MNFLNKINAFWYNKRISITSMWNFRAIWNRSKSCYFGVFEAFFFWTSGRKQPMVLESYTYFSWSYICYKNIQKKYKTTIQRTTTCGIFWNDPWKHAHLAKKTLFFGHSTDFETMAGSSRRSQNIIHIFPEVPQPIRITKKNIRA